jgi:acetone carboxylase gamma subunit
MSSESQNEFIKMVADECREMIDAEISKAPFTAVIADIPPQMCQMMTKWLSIC